MMTPPTPIEPIPVPPAPPVWRYVFPAVWLVILVLPGWIFFAERGGLGFLDGLQVNNMAAAIFPLFGLYALTLVWSQVILGSLMPLWQRLFPKIFIFHRAEGVFALLFATTHPLLLAFGVGFQSYWARDFVAPSQVKFIYFGYTALFMIYLTVNTALLMRKKIASRWWRKLHVLNYLVFVAAWIHSWNLGSDVQSTGLKYLWLWYGGSVIIAIIFRLTKIGRYSNDPI